MLDIKRMRMASNLLAAPGSEVVGQCLDEVETLRVELAALKAAARPFLDGVRLARMRKSPAVMLPLDIFDELARLCGEE